MPCADGEAAGGLAQRIEPLILRGELPPLLIVGTHSSDLRAEEYIPRDDLTRFAAHERFFVAELAAWAEQALGATTERTGRAVFGFSNGGVFRPRVAGHDYAMWEEQFTTAARWALKLSSISPAVTTGAWLHRGRSLRMSMS